MFGDDLAFYVVRALYFRHDKICLQAHIKQLFQGLSDRPPEQDDYHKTFYALKSSNNTIKLSVVRKVLIIK